MKAIRCAGCLAVAGFLALVARFWHPVFGFTALLQLDAQNAQIAVSGLRDYPVYVYRNTGPYDGLIYAQIACDPSLRDPALRKSVDNLTYRGRRILLPALAWLLAAGRPAAIARIYSWLNVAAWLALAAWLWRAIPVIDARAFAAWFGILFSAGALACVRLSLTDFIAAGLLAAGVWCAELARPRSATLLTALSGLTRETALLGLPGIWNGDRLYPKDRPDGDRLYPEGADGDRLRLAGAKGAVDGDRLCPARAKGDRLYRDGDRLLLSAVMRTLGAVGPLAAWICYVRWRVGPGDQGFGNFAVPGAGFLGKWVESWRALSTQGDKVLAATTLLAVLGLTVQAAWLVLKANPGERWWRMGAPYLILMLFLGRAVWEDFPGAAFRTLLPLTIAFNVLAARRRAPWFWLILGNLTVGSGLVALRDAPFDPQEVGGARAGAAACEVRTGTGWYGAEKLSRHRWAWSGGAPSWLDFQTWQSPSAELHCAAQLRSLIPRTVEVREGDRLLWRGEVGVKKSRVEFDVQAWDGRARIVFSTPEPPVLEGAGAGARRLAFALYDLKVSFVHASAGPH